MADQNKAFDDFWNTWYKRLSAYSKEFVQLTLEDREEAVGDMLLKAWSVLASFHPRYALSTWMYRLARNHLLNCLRANRRRLAHHQVAPEESDWPRDNNLTFQPEGALLHNETLTSLRKAVDALKPDEREIFGLSTTKPYLMPR